MVAESVPSSAPGARGVGVERSPRPIRAAAAVSAWTGRASRRLISHPAAVAKSATQRERKSSLWTRSFRDVEIGRVGSDTSTSAPAAGRIAT